MKTIKMLVAGVMTMLAGGAWADTVFDLATQTESPLVMGKTDILRYAGAEPMTTDLVITNNAPSWTTKTYITFASVFDLQNDVTFTKDVWSGWTGFVKYGPGAMIIDGGNVTLTAGLNNDNCAQKNYNVQLDYTTGSGTSPTKGFKALCLAQGAVVVNSGSFKTATQAAYASLGAWTAGEGVQEGDVLFEQNGGSSSFCATPTIGAYHGFKGFNTPNGPAKATVRVNGGTFGVSGGKIMYLGPNDNASGKTYNSVNRIEVHGGTFNTYSSQWGLRIYALPGTKSEIWVDGGTFSATKASGGMTTSHGENKGTSEGDYQQITICTNGVFKTTIAVTGYSSSNYIPLNIDVFDGGQFQFNALMNRYPKTESKPSRTITTMNVDGGTLGDYSSAVYMGVTNWISASGIDVRIGEKGATLQVTHNVTRKVMAPISTAEGIVSDGGVTIENAANGVVEYQAKMDYNGPTVVKSGWLSLAGDGALADTANNVTLIDGGLKVCGKAYELNRLTLGEEGKTSNPKIKVTDGYPLTVNSLDVLGTPRLSVSLVDADGNDLTEGRSDVEVLRVPASEQAKLEQIALVFDLTSGNTAYQKRVDIVGDTCSLVVNTVKQSLVNATWINPNGGDWTVGANWEGGEVPMSAPGVTVTFATKSVALNTVVTIPAETTVTLAQINFTCSTYGYRIMGGNVIFDNNGNGVGIYSKNCENAFYANMELKEDLYVTGAEYVARRLTMGGKMTGVGKVILNETIRFGVMGEGFAPTADKLVFPKGYYIYAPKAEVTGEGYNHPVIGGWTINDTSDLHIYANSGSSLTITNGIRLADASLDQDTDFYDQAGEVIFGNAADPIGEGPYSLFRTLTLNGRVRFNSGIVSFNSLHGNGTCDNRHIVFNGGIFRARRSSSESSFIRDASTEYYLGERGLILDTTEFELPTLRATSLAGATYTAYINSGFRRDPDLSADAVDGGITVTGGRGRVSIWRNMAGDWTGPFTLKPGTGEIVTNLVEVCAVPSLVLGEAGATDYVELGVLTNATSALGLVVSNSVTVLSPVRCVAYGQASDIEPTYVDGTSFAVLTYPASVELDLSLFDRDMRIPTAKTSCEIVTIADGDYAGWKQLRMNVVTGHDLQDATWTATSAGGDWDTSANWNGATPPDGTTKHALFNAAEKANVPVTMAEPKSLGILEIAEPADAAFGYAFSGAALSVTHNIRIPLGATTFEELAVNDDLALWTTNASSTTVRAKLTGSGRVTVNAEHYKFGGKHYFDTSSFSGKLTTGTGMTEVNDLGFVKSADDLVLSTGMLYFNPGSESPEEIEVPSLTLAGNSNYEYTSALLRIATGKTLALLGAESTARSALYLRGNGTLRLKGTGTFTFGTYHVNGSSGTDYMDYVKGAGDGPRSAFKSFSIANGKVAIGTKDDPTDAPDVHAYDIATCVRSTSDDYADPTIEMNNGKLTANNYYVSYKNAWKRSTPFVSNFNGGEVAISGALVCHESKSPIILRMNSGRFSCGNLYMGNHATGYSRFTFEQNGGETTFAKITMTTTDENYPEADPIQILVRGGTFECTGSLNFSAGTDPKGVEVRLIDGEFSYGSMTLTGSMSNGNAKLYLGGGLMKPLAAGTVDIATLDVYASTNATTLTTAGYESGDYVIANAIMHDPALTTADGGLVKTGKNDLVLKGANTFTGPLVVQEGAVRLEGAGSLASAVVLNGTTFCAPAGADVAGLCGIGAVAGSVATPMMRPGRIDEAAFAVTGDMTLASTFTIDLADIADQVKVGMTVPLCRVDGSVGELPAKVVLLNRPTTGVEKALRATLAVEDGVLVAKFAVSGMAFFVN